MMIRNDFVYFWPEIEKLEWKLSFTIYEGQSSTVEECRLWGHVPGVDRSEISNNHNNNDALKKPKTRNSDSTKIRILRKRI